MKPTAEQTIINLLKNGQVGLAKNFLEQMQKKSVKNMTREDVREYIKRESQ